MNSHELTSVEPSSRPGLSMLESDEPVGFADNFEYLASREQEMLLRASLAAVRDRVSVWDRGRLKPHSEVLDVVADLLGLAPGETTAARLEELLREHERTVKERTQQSETLFPFEQLKLDCGLNRAEEILLLALFFYANSSAFERLCDHTALALRAGDLLRLIGGPPRVQMENRVVFSDSSRLAQHNLFSAHWDANGDESLMEMRVRLPDRISRHIMGDVCTYGSAARLLRWEEGLVRMEQVVLPDADRRRVLAVCDGYFSEQEGERQSELSDFYGYGTGLAMLFYGASGTGKTMLARALASRYGCRLLSVSLDGLNGIRDAFSDPFQYIFREASLGNGIVFIDEADDLLDAGGSMSRSFLIELEKTRPMVIMATNRPLALDPALDRRIALQLRFAMPEERERKLIWQNLLPEVNRLAQDIDLDQLARDFRLSGGYIKNAILMATQKATALGRPITQEALADEARLQGRSAFVHDGIEQRYRPDSAGIDSLPVRAQTKDELRRLEIAVRRADSIGGMSALVSCSDFESAWACAEAVAGQAGLDIHRFDYDSVIGEIVITDAATQTETPLRNYAFRQHGGARSMLVFADESGRLAEDLAESPLEGPVRLFLHRVSRFPGVCIVVSGATIAGGIPEAFHQHIAVGQPPLAFQLAAWREDLSSADPAAIMALVETYSLPLREIHHVARRARVTSLLETGTEDSVLDFARALLKARFAGGSASTVLFGPERTQSPHPSERTTRSNVQADR